MSEVIKTDTQEQKKGSTKARGAYYVVREDDGDVMVRVDFWVRKSGVAGVGKGVMAFALLNAEGERVFQTSKGFTVGADAWDGKAKKTHSESFSFFGNWFDKNVVATAFTVRADKDNIGVPDSSKEWLDVLGKAVPVILGALGAGGSESLAGWVVSIL